MMLQLRRLSLVMTAAIVSACTMLGPDYKRPDNILPTQYSEEDSTAEQAAPISATWWELYQDPTLNDLVDKALQNNTDIKLAVARIEEADAFAREVGAELVPQIDLNANGSRSRATEAGSFPASRDNPSSNYNIGLGTFYEIDFWGKLRRAEESARAQALASRYAADTVALTLTGLVATNYMLLRSLDAQIAISQDTLKSREETLALTKRRNKGGVASALDVYQAEVTRTDIVAQIAELVRRRALTEHQLGILTGELNLKLAKLDSGALPLPPVPPAGLPSSLLEARPDVQQAEQQLIAANARIGVAKAALFPTISLTANYGGESTELSDLLKSAARVWTGGLSLYLPVFDSGQLNARVDQITARQKEALANYESAIQTAFTEVNDALVSVRQNAEREAALEASTIAAKKALGISENRYKSGYSSFLEVLDSQRVYNEATLAHTQSRQARLAATVDLFKSLGGGWNDNQDNLSQISPEPN